MIYVTSDLHGYPLAEFKKLLERANFSENDFLYILGDVIDRNGDGGVEMLRWIIRQQNVELVLGNHEAMLLSCDYLFKEITMESIEKLNTEHMNMLLNYLRNGGNETLKSFRALMGYAPQEVHEILDYLRYAPLYEAITVCEKDYILVHGGLGNFSPNKKLSEYTADELLWTSPDLNQKYFDDITIVFGHTPTMTYDEDLKGNILYTKTWIDVDVGVGYGNAPVLLRLDDYKEFR